MRAIIIIIISEEAAMPSSIPHFVVIRKRDKQRVMQVDVDAVIYRQGPWLAVEGDLYKLDNYRERSNAPLIVTATLGNTTTTTAVVDVPTPTISLEIVTGFTYAEHHIFPRQAFCVVMEEAHDVFWIDNDNAGLDGTSRPLLVTPQLIVMQRWTLRFITAKRVKRFNIRLALAMSLHPRIGAASSMVLASDDVVMRVVAVLERMV